VKSPGNYVSLAVVIRQVSRADVEALRSLYEEFHAFHVRGVPSHLRMAEQGEADAGEFDRAVERLVEDEDAALLVAESEGRLIGLVEVYLDPVQESPFRVLRKTATLQSLLVTEGFRGSGLGRRLVGAAEQWATERGVEEMQTKTWEFPEGPLSFYETLGYRSHPDDRER
jgi:GNAT superfamily N-acetyltransferase